MQTLFLLTIAFGTLFLAACAFGEVPEKVDYGLVKADNEFGFSLFNGLAETSPHENIFISPISIAIALQMCYNGADGKTKSQMAEVMNIARMPIEALNQANQQLIWHLSSSEEVQLEIANSLWARKGVPFREEYITGLQEYYDASANERNFEDPAVLKEINSWVAEKTNGKIDRILDQLDPIAILVLINAVYFKGAWFDQFNANITKEDDFYLYGGGTQKVQMMFKRDDYNYLEADDFQAIRLPYKDRNYEMVIVLPAEGEDLSEFMKNKGTNWWNETLGKFSYLEGRLYLPRFKTEYDVTLNDALISMGMKEAFEETAADFSGITPADPAWISRVIHKTFIEVDEEGTEAAAVTAIEMVGETMAPIDPEEPFTMRIDRPFFCGIIERSSGAILFMGNIFKPN
ncbi:MAG TPA: serpin family protein [candidate division Zixibacteria bacterium]|nr:serpin family protein [candidate division Zixibacteria bacterium]